jgi:hypothetical protein
LNSTPDKSNDPVFGGIENAAISTLASSASVIAVASSLSAAGANAASGSLYLVQVCPVGTTRDSIGASELPPAVAQTTSLPTIHPTPFQKHMC